MIRSTNSRYIAALAAGLSMLVVSSAARAAGVSVGSSSLMNTLDYSDTFTGTDHGGRPNRPYIAAVQPAPAYIVENTYGKPSISFQSASFSFAADANGPGALGLVNGSPAYPAGWPNASGAGSNTGFTQTGGGVDYGIAYGLRENYIVQVDAVQVPDRIDISSGASVGIFAPNSLSVFFRGNGSGNASLFNGVTDTPIQTHIPSFHTGITGAGIWYNYAVRYDRTNKQIEIFVDQVSKGVIDLTTFAGGIYQNFSGAVVGAGGSPGGGANRVWTDNFQVGGNGPPDRLPPEPHPNPGPLANLPGSLISYWDFNEAGGVVEGRLLNFAYDRKGTNHGSFRGTATRAPGLIGQGAGQFNGQAADGVDVGTAISASTGIAIEALFTTYWAGTNQAEFFRKEDGGNRILLSFQSGVHINNNFGQLVGTAGVPGISLGLNVGGAYKELDIAFDGLDGRPTLAQIADGNVHHIVANYNSATGEKAIWIDGTKIGSVTDSGLITSGGGAVATIGNVGNSEPFYGLLDEVAVYNAALSPAEIAFHLANVARGQHYFVPEPSSWALALLGFGGMLLIRRRRSAA